MVSSESMMVAVEDVMMLGISHKLACQDMLHYFTYHAGKAYWSIVGGLIFLPFFVDRAYICSLPVVWNHSLIKRGLKECGEWICKNIS